MEISCAYLLRSHQDSVGQGVVSSRGYSRSRSVSPADVATLALVPSGDRSYMDLNMGLLLARND